MYFLKVLPHITGLDKSLTAGKTTRRVILAIQIDFPPVLIQVLKMRFDDVFFKTMFLSHVPPNVKDLFLARYIANEGGASEARSVAVTVPILPWSCLVAKTLTTAGIEMY